MSSTTGKLYLVPSLLDDDAVATIPAYIIDAVKDSQVFFVENERTTRRFFKKINREIVIDNYEWFVIEGAGTNLLPVLKQKLAEGKNIGLISEAGCPGVADPGQQLIAAAMKLNVEVRPLVGPNSIILALMASGMNGQQFEFVGYLPVNESERASSVRDLESESKKKNSTKIFIETPYRNNQLIATILKTCKPSTKFCIAADLTGKNEWIKTKTIGEWKKETINLHKRPAIFLLLAE